MNKILLTNIQRFSLHDGPGIRTTVFLKGCSLHCPWCSNPENIVPRVQKYIKNGQIGFYGFEYDCDELYDEIIKDKVFYSGDWSSYDLDKMPGGVTFSGGECLLQMDRMRPLLERLSADKIHTTIETSLFASELNLDIALKYVDLFYVDVKILVENNCHSILGGKIGNYYSNLRSLLASAKPIVFRVPIIGGYTDVESNRKKVKDLFKTIDGNVLKVELIKEHNLGLGKYKSLIDGDNDICMPNYIGVKDELIEHYKGEIEEVVNIPVEICRI